MCRHTIRRRVPSLTEPLRYLPYSCLPFTSYTSWFDFHYRFLFVCVCVFLTKCAGLTAMLPYVFNHLLGQAILSHCMDSYITSCCNQGWPSYTLKEATASILLYHCQNVAVSVTSATPNSTSAILFHQSSRRHRCHLPTLRHGLALLRPSSSTTYPHAGTLPPRHLAFPTTSRLPQALPLSHFPTSAPSRFSLSNHVRSSSGTPTFNVHKQVAPTLPSGYGGRSRNLSYLTYGLSGRSLTSGVGYRRPEPQEIFNTLRGPLTSGQGNASLTLG